MRYRNARIGTLLGIVVAVTMLSQATFAQTQIKLHGNKYSKDDDVKLGREAAAEAEKKLQLLSDAQLNAYVERVGARLVAQIPPEFQHPEFRYSFKVVNAKEINAFALPGGPMYVNSGMISAAKTEAEMAGVMAHEISHVALRHGTAQATKAQKYNTLSQIMGIGGQVLGGPLGTAAQIGSQGLGVYFLKYSREYESEADILGARIMAAAGYEPRDLANMFKTIEGQGGGSGGWFSSHPSPKDRYSKINKEAEFLKVNTAATPDSKDFVAAQQRLAGGTANFQQALNTPDGTNPPNVPTGRVENPSSRHVPYDKGVFSVNIPENWRPIEEQNGLWFAPAGGYGAVNGQNVFTHAVNLGAVRPRTRDPQQAADEFVNAIAQGNNLRARGSRQTVDVNGRPGQLSTFDNVNEATGKPELVNIITTRLRSGELFYMIAVSPRDEYQNYHPTFAAILRSVRLKY
jgi:Zn-dependent protease with chaperone function